MIGDIRKICEKYGVYVITYPIDDFISIGSVEFACTYREPYGESNRLTYSIFFADKFYTYISRGMFKDDTIYFAERVLYESNVLILGSYGEKESGTFTFRYNLDKLEAIIINTPHVALDTYYLEYYEQLGTKIHSFPKNLVLK